MFCPNCGNKVDQAKFCPSCGSKLYQGQLIDDTSTDVKAKGFENTYSKQTQADNQNSLAFSQGSSNNKQAGSNKISKKKKSLLLLIPLVLLVIYLFMPSEEALDKAYIDCAKVVISENLYSPASAQYSNEKVLEKDDYGRAVVTMTVDAQNGFGALLRQNYVVVITSFDKGTLEFTYNKEGIQSWAVNEDYLADVSISFAKEASNWNIDPKQ